MRLRTASPSRLRAENALVAYAVYLGKANRARPTRGVLSAPCAGLSRLAGRGRRAPPHSGDPVCPARAASCPWFAVGWLWFLGTLVPVIGLVQVAPGAGRPLRLRADDRPLRRGRIRRGRARAESRPRRGMRSSLLLVADRRVDALHVRQVGACEGRVLLTRALPAIMLEAVLMPKEPPRLRGSLGSHANLNVGALRRKVRSSTQPATRFDALQHRTLHATSGHGKRLGRAFLLGDRRVHDPREASRHAPPAPITTRSPDRELEAP